MKKVERYDPNIEEGLTSYQVNKRIEDNLVNIDTEVSTKSVSEIVRQNVMTLFNIINIILAIAVICVGSFKNLLYKLLFIFIKGEDEVMMAMLFASKIILGKATFDKVPAKLKGQVAEILIDNGCEDMITDPEYLPKDENAETE